MRPHYLAGNKLELDGFSLPIKNLQIFASFYENDMMQKLLLKFIFSKKVTKIDKIFTVDLTLFT